MVFSLSIPLASIIFRTSSLKSDSGDSVISTFALSCSSICFTHLWFIIWFIVYLLDTSRTNMCRMRCSQSTGENSLDQYKAAFTLGAQVRYSLSTNVNPLPPFFSSNNARIWTRCLCLGPGTRTQKWAPGPCEDTAIVSFGAATVWHSILSSCFKMASDRARMSYYVHS